MGTQKSDWIEWSGGDRPVSDRASVATRWSDGSEAADGWSPHCGAKFLRWDHLPNFPNIIAYRTVSA